MPADPAGFRRLRGTPEPGLSGHIDADGEVNDVIHGSFGVGGRSVGPAPSSESPVAYVSSGEGLMEEVSLDMPALSGAIFPGDLDGDGREDLLQARWEDGAMTLEWIRNTSD